MNKTLIFRLLPVFLNFLLILWTLIISSYSKYGDNWAIYPAFSIFPLIVVIHLALFYFEKPKINFVVYGLAHGTVSFYLWIYCLMQISKDAL